MKIPFAAMALVALVAHAASAAVTPVPVYRANPITTNTPQGMTNVIIAIAGSGGGGGTATNVGWQGITNLTTMPLPASAITNPAALQIPGGSVTSAVAAATVALSGWPLSWSEASIIGLISDLLNRTMTNDSRNLSLSGSNYVGNVAVAGRFSGAGSNLTSLAAGALTGTVPSANLGTGVADGSSFLRGDGTWAVPASMGGIATNAIANTNGTGWGTTLNSPTMRATTVFPKSGIPAVGNANLQTHWQITNDTSTETFNFSSFSENYGGVYFDDVVTWGWNLNGQGTLVDQTRPGFGYGFEREYHGAGTIATNDFEHHMYLVHTNGGNGIQYRPWTWNFGRYLPLIKHTEWANYLYLGCDMTNGDYHATFTPTLTDLYRPVQFHDVLYGPGGNFWTTNAILPGDLTLGSSQLGLHPGSLTAPGLVTVGSGMLVTNYLQLYGSQQLIVNPAGGAQLGLVDSFGVTGFLQEHDRGLDVVAQGSGGLNLKATYSSAYLGSIRLYTGGAGGLTNPVLFLDDYLHQAVFDGPIIGNGIGLTNVAGSNITGSVTWAQKADVGSNPAQALLGVDGSYRMTVTSITPGLAGAQPTNANLTQWSGLGTNVLSGLNGISNVVDSGYTAIARNLVVQTNLTGNGSGLTNLPAGQLTGTVADARLSANVPLLSGNQLFSGANEFLSSVQFDGTTVATNLLLVAGRVNVGSISSPSTTNQIEINTPGGKVNVGTNGVLYGNGSGLTGIASGNATNAIANTNGTGWGTTLHSATFVDTITLSNQSMWIYAPPISTNTDRGPIVIGHVRNLQTGGNFTNVSPDEILSIGYNIDASGNLINPLDIGLSSVLESGWGYPNSWDLAAEYHLNFKMTNGTLHRPISVLATHTNLYFSHLYESSVFQLSYPTNAGMGDSGQNYCTWLWLTPSELQWTSPNDNKLGLRFTELPGQNVVLLQGTGGDATSDFYISQFRNINVQNATFAADKFRQTGVMELWGGPFYGYDSGGVFNFMLTTNGGLSLGSDGYLTWARDHRADHFQLGMRPFAGQDGLQVDDCQGNMTNLHVATLFGQSVVAQSNFAGNGSGLTNLPAGQLTGTVSDARLSANVPLLNGNQAFSGANEWLSSVQFDGTATVTNLLLVGARANVGSTAAPSSTNQMEIHTAGGMVNVGTNGVLYGSGAGLTGVASATATNLPAGVSLTNVNLVGTTTGATFVATSIYGTQTNKTAAFDSSGQLTAATAAQVVTTLGSTAVAQATHATNADSATTASGGWPTTWSGGSITSAVAEATHATNADNATTASGGWPTTWAESAITGLVADLASKLATNGSAAGLTGAVPQATHATNADWAQKADVGSNPAQALLGVDGAYRMTVTSITPGLAGAQPTNNALTVLESGNGGALTNIAGTNLTSVGVTSGYVPTANGSGGVTWAAQTGAPVSQSGNYYVSTTIVTGTNSDQSGQPLYGYQSTIPTSSVRSYATTDFLTNGGYVGSVVTTNTFLSLGGTIGVNAFLGFVGGGGSPSLSMHAEVYYSYDKTNWYGDYSSQSIVITSGATNLYQWAISFPAYSSTNSSGFYVERRYRVDSVTGTGGRTLYVLIGTNSLSGVSDAAHITMQGPTTGGTVTSVNVAIPGLTSSGAVTGSGTITMTPKGDIITNGYSPAELSISNTVNAWNFKASGLATATGFKVYPLNTLNIASWGFPSSYETNLSANIVLSAPTIDDTSFEGAYILCLNSSGSDKTVTLPANVRSMDGARVYTVTNNTARELWFRHMGTLATNVTTTTIY